MTRFHLSLAVPVGRPAVLWSFAVPRAVGRMVLDKICPCSGLAVPGGLDNRWSGVAEVLIGRSTELALIGAFVERAGTGGEALLLVGEPGAGKTALLDAAADAAEE